MKVKMNEADDRGRAIVKKFEIPLPKYYVDILERVAQSDSISPETWLLELVKRELDREGD